MALAVAVFLPAVLWTQWNNAVPGEEQLARGAVISLNAVGSPEPVQRGRCDWSSPTKAATDGAPPPGRTDKVRPCWFTIGVGRGEGGGRSGRPLGPFRTAVT